MVGAEQERFRTVAGTKEMRCNRIIHKLVMSQAPNIHTGNSRAVSGLRIKTYKHNSTDKKVILSD